MKRTPLARTSSLKPGGSLARSTGIRRVSAKRARENRERKAMATAAGLTAASSRVCVVPWCPRLADDLHEPLTRARGGSITDEDNTVPVCPAAQRGTDPRTRMGDMSWACSSTRVWDAA